jgi:hypothetical protein
VLADDRDVLDVLLFEVGVIDEQEPACLAALRVYDSMVEQIELAIMVDLDYQGLVETLREGVDVDPQQEVRHQVRVEVIHDERTDAVFVWLCAHLRGCRQKVWHPKKVGYVDQEP